ncbi:hypothetical protein DL766_001848 [Monosporascus sp. MC13-8B]|uniref:Phosphatidic acid phosphatase type 2/haloperoxidase domain-containing protein n=1 Tax=Monosporascus cannonballus TaxID=155416 RepID=A0ABY0H860_9PEZI|nr:hypothetical protein DL762_005815 [Monosporascus cannonballus]RYP36731.1 hypothetical protein DL766_001848 [Monosporascus sp. MC13-8B]
MDFLSSWRRREPPVPRDPHTHTRQQWIRTSEHYSLERRPMVVQWLRLTWLDLLGMAILAIVNFLLYRAKPPVTRTFPLTVVETGEVVYPQFAYPYRQQIIAPWLDAFLGAAIPIVVILLAQIRIRSFWDVNNGIIGLAYGLLTSVFFVVMIKLLVGGLRPHFYDVCKPDPTLASQAHHNTTGLNGVGYQNYMYTSEICTVDHDQRLWNALESFPSGHSSTIFAGMVFLYLYLNAKLKVFSNYHPSMWKLVVLYLPILFACIIAGLLTVDRSHNWYDIVAGAVIGIVIGFSAYRMVYASIWDYHTNHIPLNRNSAFLWSEGCEGSGMVFTGKAGWRAGSLRGQDILPTHNGQASGFRNDNAHTTNNGLTYGNGNTVQHHEKPTNNGMTNGKGGTLQHPQRSMYDANPRGHDMV